MLDILQFGIFFLAFCFVFLCFLALGLFIAMMFRLAFPKTYKKLERRLLL